MKTKLGAFSRCIICAILMTGNVNASGKSAAELDRARLPNLVRDLAETVYKGDSNDVFNAAAKLKPYRSLAIIEICNYACKLDANEKLSSDIKDNRMISLSIALKQLLGKNIGFLHTIADSESENLKVLVLVTEVSLPNPEWSEVKKLSKDKSARVKTLAISFLRKR